MPVFLAETMYLLLMNLCLTKVMDYTDLLPGPPQSYPNLKVKVVAWNAFAERLVLLFVRVRITNRCVTIRMLHLQPNLNPLQH